ncbi:MAG: EamA family transporter [Paenibacillaceae bacterium]|nr:EamA family transporter [Paenibacillaceae bacterium]
MKKTYWADGVLLFVAFVWGIMFVFIKEAVGVMEPLGHLAVRFALAALILLGGYAACGRSREQINRGLFRHGGILGFWLFLGFMFQTVGTQYTTASKTGFITGLCVVLVPLLGALLFKIKLTRITGAGIGIAFAGMAVLSLHISEPVAAGDIIVLFGSVAFAVHILLTGRYAAHHHPMALACVQVAAAAVLNLAGAALFEDVGQLLRPEIWLNPLVLRAVVIGAVFATAFAYWAQTHFQRYTSATHTAIIFSSEPVFAAAAAVVIGGESITMQTALGGILILSGILIAELKG